MSYHLEKKNPYAQKKASFKKKFCSTVLVIFACGVLTIASGRFASLHAIAEETEKYQVTISHYNELVDKIAIYMKENGGTNPEECFKIYTGLLWDGYFSKDKNYEYSTEDRNNVAGNEGIRIVTGEGDCKTNEDLFYKIMKKMGFQAYQVASSQNKLTLKNLIFGNHIITVVDYNGVQYYFDSTNGCSYKKIGMNLIQNENKKIVITLKPLMSYIYGYNDELETLHLIANAPGLKSGQALEVEKRFNIHPGNSKKILLLRKSIEPQLCNIYDTIINEG